MKRVRSSFILPGGLRYLADSLGLRTRDSVLKDSRFINQKLSFVETSQTALVYLGLLKSFKMRFTLEKKQKAHPTIPEKFETTVCYNTQLDFSIVKESFLG